MKDITELPITIQIAQALKTPELFSKEKYKQLMRIKDLICERMYQEYVKERI